MKTYIFLILSLFQFSIVYSQKGSNLKLVYCEELMSDQSFYVNDYGKDIIGYYQLVDEFNSNTEIQKINNLLKIWHTNSYIDSRIDPKLRLYLFWINKPCEHKIDEVRLDSFDWKEKVIKLKKSKLVKDTLAPSDKYILLGNLNVVLYDYPGASYIYKVFNDSIFFFSLMNPYDYGSGYQKSVIYNIKTGKEIGFYDCLAPNKYNEFIIYLFNRAITENKSALHDISINPRYENMLRFNITLFPTMYFDTETKVLAFNFGSHTPGFYSGSSLILGLNHVKKYLNPDCVFFKIQDLIK